MACRVGAERGVTVGIIFEIKLRLAKDRPNRLCIVVTVTVTVHALVTIVIVIIIVLILVVLATTEVTRINVDLDNVLHHNREDEG